MARPRPPNTFSNKLERWIYKEHVGSIVSVEFRPDSNKVLERWDQVALIQLGTPEYEKRVTDSTRSVYCTGSILGEDQGGRMLILTCAHGLCQAFSSEEPIAACEIEELYQAYVLCDHRERRFQRGEDLERVRSRATIVEIDCESDLLLLQVSRGHMMHYCIEPHKPVIFSNRSAKALKRVVMLSWPWNRNRTAVSGHISHRGRNIADVCQTNPFGFTTRLGEIDITSDYGSLSAPLFNGSGDGIGGDGRFFYSITLNVVRQTLAQWGGEIYAAECF